MIPSDLVGSIPDVLPIKTDPCVITVIPERFRRAEQKARAFG